MLELVNFEKSEKFISIRYIDSITLKQFAAKDFNTVDICYDPLFTENYFAINIRNGVDNKEISLYDRVVYDVRNGAAQKLKENLHGFDCHGEIYHGSVFIYDDAIYDFERQFKLTGIKRFIGFMVKTEVDQYICYSSYDGTEYVFIPEDLSSKPYNSTIEGVASENYLLKSLKRTCQNIGNSMIVMIKLLITNLGI